MGKGAALGRGRLEILLDLGLVRLRLGDLGPGLGHDRVELGAHQLGARPHRPEILLEAGLLLRVEVELSGNLLRPVLPARQVAQPRPGDAADKKQVQHDRDGQQHDQEAPPPPRRRGYASIRRRSHDSRPSLMLRSTPPPGSIRSPIKLSSLDGEILLSATEASVPSAKPSQLATTIAAAMVPQRATIETPGCGCHGRRKGITSPRGAATSAAARATAASGASPCLAAASARAAATSPAAPISAISSAATRSCSSSSRRDSAKPARSSNCSASSGSASMARQ